MAQPHQGSPPFDVTSVRTCLPRGIIFDTCTLARSDSWKAHHPIERLPGPAAQPSQCGWCSAAAYPQHPRSPTRDSCFHDTTSGIVASFTRWRGRRHDSRVCQDNAPCTQLSRFETHHTWDSARLPDALSGCMFARLPIRIALSCDCACCSSDMLTRGDLQPLN
jgi:hypothetical protein